jgi:HlyD family secretion protein
MSRVVRIFVTVIVLSAVVILSVQYFQAQRAAQAAQSGQASLVQDEAIVQTGDLTVTVSATGSIMPARQVGLVFELSAPVSEVLVQVGQSVKQGDVLARLDVSDLEGALNNAQLGLETQQVAYDALTTPAREVDIAVVQAAVNAALAQAGAASLGAGADEIEIARLQAELARNQLWQAQLQRDLGPAQIEQLREQLQASGLGSGALPPPVNPADNVSPQITQAEFGVELADVQAEGVINQPPDVAALSSANAQLVAAQAQLDRLLNGPTDMELQVAETQLAIAQLSVEAAQAALNRGTLVAPFDGVIAEHNLVVGETPPTDQAAIQLIDPSGFYVDVAVDETDIVKLAEGQVVELRLDALPDDQITGVVTRVAITPVRAGQLVTYTARVTLDPTDAPVRVGMTATATIVVNKLENVLTVPNRFIRIDRATQQAYVTIQRGNGAFEEVQVTLGVRNETESQIISGIEAGERVVLLPRGSFNPIER